MSNIYAELCLQRAEECCQMADKSENYDVCASWIKLAEDWLRLAEDIRKCAPEEELAGTGRR
jgi:hypothetical protein